MRVEGATGQLRGPAARRERAGSVGVGDGTHRVLMEGVRWRDGIFGSLDGAAMMRAGERGEGA